MKLELVVSPKLLIPEHIHDRTVIVLDVLRATTTMIVALCSGAKEIRVFNSIDAARDAAKLFTGHKLLHGEVRALPPPGFDLGNSPGDFTPDRCQDRTQFMATTNGTVAILAAAEAADVLIGAVVNATSVARQSIKLGRDITLLCAGQRMDVAWEDVLGCGIIINRLRQVTDAHYINDACHMAEETYEKHRNDLAGAFRRCRGAQSELKHGLSADIDYCAVADRFDCVGRLDPDSESIKRIV